MAHAPAPLLILCVAHAAISLAWLLVAFLCARNVAPFAANTLVLTHMATAFFIALFRVRRTWRFFAWAVLVTDALGFAGMGLYLSNLVASRALGLDPHNDPARGLANYLADVMWHQELPLAVALLSLLVATAVLHFAVIVTLSIMLFHRGCRRRHCDPDAYALYAADALEIASADKYDD